MNELKLKVAGLDLSLEVEKANMQVQMDDKAYNKMMFWVDRAGGDEVSGLGMVEVKDGVLRVTEVFLLPQENASGTTDIEPEAMGKLMYETRDMPGELKFWWHSHVRMAVFWSGTDRATIDAIAHGGWFLSMVVNQNRERLCAFRSKDPDLFLDKVPSFITTQIPEALTAQWDTEYQAKVKKKTYGRSLEIGKGLTKKERKQLKRERREERKRIGITGPTATDSNHGIWAGSSYRIYIDRDKVETTDITPTKRQIETGFIQYYYKPEGYSYEQGDWLSLQQLAEAALAYALDWVSVKDKLIFDDEMSQEQIELLPDWDQYRDLPYGADGDQSEIGEAMLAAAMAETPVLGDTFDEEELQGRIDAWHGMSREV